MSNIRVKLAVNDLAETECYMCCTTRTNNMVQYFTEIEVNYRAFEIVNIKIEIRK